MYEVFFEGCYTAAENCTLYREDDTSAKDIQDRVDEFILDLDKTPQVARVHGRNETGRDLIISGGDVRYMFGSSAYSAVFSYTRVAAAMDKAMTKGDYSSLLPLFTSPEIEDKCKPADPSFPMAIEEQGLAIRCVDGDDVTNKTVDWWVDYMDDLLEQSDIFGQGMVAGRMACAGWPVRSNWDYNGPFESPEADPEGVEGKPLAPIFFMSSRLDPITPLEAARKMSKEHPGSKVMVLEGEGHCAVMTGPSKCRDNLLKEYMHTGELPDKWETSCEMDCGGPWDECEFDLAGVSSMALVRGELQLVLHDD